MPRSLHIGPSLLTIAFLHGTMRDSAGRGTVVDDIETAGYRTEVVPRQELMAGSVTRTISASHAITASTEDFTVPCKESYRRPSNQPFYRSLPRYQRRARNGR